MKAITICIAVVLGIFAIEDRSLWGLLAAFAMTFVAYAAPEFWDDRRLRRQQKNMAHVATEAGICPHGYKGEYDRHNIYTRCKGACYEMCYDCILFYISGQGEGYRERIQRMNQMGLEFPASRPDYERREDVQSTTGKTFRGRVST